MTSRRLVSALAAGIDDIRKGETMFYPYPNTSFDSVRFYTRLRSALSYCQYRRKRHFKMVIAPDGYHVTRTA